MNMECSGFRSVAAILKSSRTSGLFKIDIQTQRVLDVMLCKR
ncbi:MULTISPECIES: hypothetical protein [unclassified Nostoc]|nr:MULTISPECIES: hypothetical protein [unclassified Nostoc]